MANTGPRTYRLYQYPPSLGAAVLFCLLFLSTTLVHFIQMWKRKSWFLIPLIIGGLLEFIGYACRTTSARSPPGQYRLMPFVIQNTYILIAPALFAATIYMTLGRVIRLTDGNSRSLIRGDKLTRFFLLGDVFCFILQGIGGGLIAVKMTTPGSTIAKIGANVILAGVILQMVWFFFFIIVAAFFQARMRASPTITLQNRSDIRWQRYLLSLYLASSLVIIRSLFRLVEYSEGVHGYLQGHEVFFYVFDSVPMLSLMLWMNINHPSEISLLLRKYDRESGVSELTIVGKGIEITR